MTFVNQIQSMIEKEMLPVTLEISECAEGIRLYGRFLDKAEVRIVSLGCIGRLDENVLIDNIIGVAYRIKSDLLHATCDYVRTPGS